MRVNRFSKCPPSDAPMSVVPHTLANPSPRFCPSYQYFARFDDIADDVYVVGEEELIESLQ